MINEIWKDIPGYEGYYQVSNLGRVISVDRTYVSGNGCIKKVGGELKYQRTNNGYLRVALSKNGVKRFKLVHRIVADVFISNPNNLPFVNHKDECKTNNFVDNLEWCNQNYNNSYGTRLKRCAISCSKPIVQCFKNGKPFIFWLNARQVERSIFNVHNTQLSMCLKGKCKTGKGYIWRRPTKDEMKYIEQYKDKLVEFYK